MLKPKNGNKQAFRILIVEAVGTVIFRKSAGNKTNPLRIERSTKSGFFYRLVRGRVERPS
jgi:hypothetical protein